LFRFNAVRASHFLPSLFLLLAGLAAAYVRDLSVFFTSLFNVLPTLVLLLGGAYCAVYRRQRELFLMLTVYIAYFLLDTQTDFYRDHGRVREDAAVIFHLVCLLLPALFGLYGAWQERTHLLQDLVARGAVLFAVGSVAVALQQSYPEALLTWLAEIRWPALHGHWMSLIQMVYPLFLGVFILLVVQYLRAPRPLHAAQLIGLLGIFWMLPQTFILPFTLNIMCSQVMLMIAAAVAHEAYQMAFRDELTGLPGRRALNERMQRLGRNYVIAMTDVDHFKKFNDTHGHDVGDQVLRLVVRVPPSWSMFDSSLALENSDLRPAKVWHQTHGPDRRCRVSRNEQRFARDEVKLHLSKQGRTGLLLWRGGVRPGVRRQDCRGMRAACGSRA